MLPPVWLERIRDTARDVLHELPSLLRAQLTQYQHGVTMGRQPLDDLLAGAHGRVIYAAFAPVRRVLAARGPAVRLYRGEPLDAERTERRTFLSWTDDYRVAWGLSRNGIVRVAMVSLRDIIAVLPHGPGVEFIVPTAVTARARVQRSVVSGYVDIAPYGASHEAGYWLPGTELRRVVERAIRGAGGHVHLWRARRDNDGDYWSGYPPVADHGTYYFTVSRAAWPALQVVLRARALDPLDAGGLHVTPPGFAAVP